MRTKIHKAESRGHANHGWLDTYHTFSFSSYQNAERNNFGALKVLNDDKVAAGKGFGTHAHSDMEIISIPLVGDLEHQDSMGNKGFITEGEIQVMSAGTGIKHSEYNRHKNKDVEFLQIWVSPRQNGLKPRYDQVSILDLHEKNKLYQVLSPTPKDQGVWIHQDAWFNLGDFNEPSKSTYVLHKETNGVYFFILEGEITIGNKVLLKRDGMEITGAESIEFEVSANTRILVMEVPMQL